MKIAPLLLAASLSLLSTNASPWPQWRGGADGSGITTEKNLPLEWSATRNIRWKVPLPDSGNSTPVVWGDRVFVTQAIEKENRRTLLCLSRRDGRTLWQSGVTWAEKDDTHETNPYCAASPATDGERVIVTFASAGVFCYDMDGKELWRRDLGSQRFVWGNASSPVLHGDLCFLYHGPGKDAVLLALDKRTGKTVWSWKEPTINPGARTDGFRGREQNGVICTYSTPILVPAAGREELVMTFPQTIRAFDPKTGRELWHCDGLNPLVYTSPVHADGVVVGMGGFFGTSAAVRTGGQGDVTATHRLWRTERTKNRLGTGVIYGGHIYVLNTPGVAECIELKTGKVVWEERVRAVGPKGESWSSMVLAGDRIYILNQSGDTAVLRASPKFELFAVNSIGNELCNASLAPSDGDLFIRTHRHLWCVGEGAAKNN